MKYIIITLCLLFTGCGQFVEYKQRETSFVPQEDGSLKVLSQDGGAVSYKTKEHDIKVDYKKEHSSVVEDILKLYGLKVIESD